MCGPPSLSFKCLDVSVSVVVVDCCAGHLKDDMCDDFDAVTSPRPTGKKKRHGMKTAHSAFTSSWVMQLSVVAGALKTVLKIAKRTSGGSPVRCRCLSSSPRERFRRPTAKPHQVRWPSLGVLALSFGFRWVPLRASVLSSSSRWVGRCQSLRRISTTLHSFTTLPLRTWR